jgi:exosortase/archaeosortase
MPSNIKLRKWHFLALGGTLILLSAYLWYWNWRSLGIPAPLRPEHYLTIASYVVGVLVLVAFVFRLNKQQATIMLVGMVVVNLVAALVSLWIFRNYTTVFDWLCPMDLSQATPAYLADWKQYFLTPALYIIHGGLLLVWVVTLVIFIVRNPADQPE